MRAFFVLIPVFILLAAGCSKTAKLQSREAVQTAIESHLKQRPNVTLANMSLEIDEVKFSAEAAEAEVKFRSKQSPDLVVGVHYRLRQAGDHWQVESSTPSSGMGTSPHGGGAPSAPTHAPAESPLQSSH